MKDQINDSKTDISNSRDIKSNWRLAGFLISLTVIVSLIAFYRVKMQFFIGPPWDTYAFLSNALYFAGKSIGYVEIERPPFLSVLVSLVFRFNYISESVIYYVDAVIFVFGVIGLFLLLNLRFDKLKSFFGAMFYACSPVVLLWVGTGYTDIAGVSFTIWAVFLTVLATNKNSKFFYLAFPLLMISFLTRYNMAFIILPLIFCIISTKNLLKHLKNIIISALLSLLILTPFLILYYITYGDPFFPFISTLSLTESLQAEKVAYIADNLYYLKNIPNFALYYAKIMPNLTYTLFIIPIAGILFYVYNIIKRNFKRVKTQNKVLNAFDLGKKRNRIKYILLTILVIAFVVSFNKFSYITTDLIFFLLCILIYNIFRDSERFLALDLTIAIWLVAFLAFHSSYGVKVDRYFLTMIAPLSYFLVLGFSEITDKLIFNVKNVNVTNLIVYPLLILLLISSSFTYVQEIPSNDEFTETMNVNKDINNLASWYVKNVKDDGNKKIVSDYWPALSWILKRNVHIMSSYTNQSYIINDLEKNGYDYYFSSKDIDSPYYDVVKEIGMFKLYGLNSTIPPKTEIFYIGASWHRYVEDVLDFKAYLRFDLRSAGRFGIGRSVYIDNYSPDELRQYPYLFLYNFKWHDRNNAERIISEYTKNGGTVVIDASGNLNGVMYNLDNSVFINTTITRSALPTNPTLWINPVFSNESYKFAPFVSEDGIWYGATYSALSPNKLESIATLDDKLLIGVQRIGKGKIIWVGYNFIWHSFFYENEDEKQFIQRIIGL
ncbi:glycosyltransferase family 39 protein [Methanobacterium alcaliphilum]|uniref:glycosyltransferase family 39 protein n=1 Tax=Methanobacterium alcaliphilum TaxID=392018 RepID=UPI002009E427|nr:glycosyltransferase family 39 protein [Methanobacterium alcaliphilum]MCK9151777.1 glycosyltransferase family 39 protein [Methanobacterium alcaliphilum]